MCDELACIISGCWDSTGKLVFGDLGDTNRIIEKQTKRLGPMIRCKEIWWKNKNENSLIFQNILNWSDSAPMQVSRKLWGREYLTTLDDAELDKLGSSCREYTLLRDDTSSKVKGWIRGNTKIGPALEVAVSYHQGRYGVEIMFNSFSAMELVHGGWLNGTNKYVTETSEETQENHIDIGDSTVKPIARARQEQTPSPTSSSPTITLPYHQRQWIDVEPTKYDESCSEVSKRRLHCFDTILQYFEKKTEQSNSESWHQCFIQDSRLLSVLVNSNMAKILARRRWSPEEISVLCGSTLCWYHLVLSSNSRPLWRKTHWSYMARQRVVAERLRREHLPRWKLPRSALDHPSRIDSRWERRQEREACCVLHGRELNVHRSPQEKGITTWRGPELQCTNTLGKYTKTQFIGVILRLLKGRDYSSVKHDQTRSLFATFYLRCASRRWWSESQEKTCTAEGTNLLLYLKDL